MTIREQYVIAYRELRARHNGCNVLIDTTDVPRLMTVKAGAHLFNRDFTPGNKYDTMRDSILHRRAVTGR